MRQYRGFGRAFAIVSLCGALWACDAVESLLTDAVKLEGTIRDTNGDPVEGAEVSVYLFSDNLEAFKRSDDPVDVSNIAAYEGRVDLGVLQRTGNVAKRATSGADGKYSIEDIPINGIIATATKASYSVDIAGMDEEKGTISQGSALKPASADSDSLTVTIKADFVLAGGPIKEPQVEPVVPPTPPTPPEPEPPPPPPEPECTDNAGCGDGMICSDGECGPECTEAVDCAHIDARMICTAEQRCDFECNSDDDCSDDQLCDAATLLCEAAECGAAAACAVGECSDEAAHGRCVAGCEDDAACADSNMICDLEVLRCAYECVGDADCGADSICDDNHCMPAECLDDDACIADGAAGGFCRDMRCVPECEADDACTDRNMICDVTTKRCKLECIGNSDCGDDTPLCLDNHCVPAECDGDEACIAGDDPAGGFCLEFVCAPQCTAETAAVDCEHDAALCELGRCVMPDPNDLLPPAESAWTSFVIGFADADGMFVELADASGDNADIAIDHPIVVNGGEIAIRATASDTSLDTAWLRVQNGASRCDDEAALPPKVDLIPLHVRDGVVISDLGDFQPWFLSGGYEKLQLDTDEEVGNGGESFLVEVDERCAPPPRPMTVTLTWGADRVDVDLHVWNVETEEHTFYGAHHDGNRATSGYGAIDVDDRDGFGPEIFTLNEGEAGSFAVRAHFFSGLRTNAPAPLQARVVRFHDGTWHDETFEAPIEWRGWLDIGTFEVSAP